MKIKFKLFIDGKLKPVTKLVWDNNDLLAFVSEYTFIRNPKNLAQSTGLIDVLGKEIYTGHIIEEKRGKHITSKFVIRDIRSISKILPTTKDSNWMIVGFNIESENA